MKTLKFRTRGYNEFFDTLDTTFDFTFENDSSFEEFAKFAPYKNHRLQAMHRNDFETEHQKIFFDMINDEAQWALADKFQESDDFDGVMPLSMEDAFDIEVYWPRELTKENGKTQ